MKQPYSYYNHNDNNHNSSSLLTSSITPLHLAAQNGHIAITSYLLINQYDADLGFILPSSSSSSSSSEHNNNNNIEKQKYIQKYKLSTPLHRACYSGSLSCIKLLLDFGANIFSIDYSMDDGMTPLHKAIKGGRYLVVLFLLDYLKSGKNDNDNNNNNDDDNNNNHSSCILLKKALEIKDKRNRKPIDLALELQSIGEDAILSVRRWDVVAGGEANFNDCVTLLQNAEKECNNSYNNDYNNDDYNNDGNEKIIMSSNNKIVLNDIISKCNCENNSNDDNQCKTSIWEAQFHSAMLQSTQTLMKESNLNNNNTTNNNDQNNMSHEALQHNNNNDNADSDTKDESNNTRIESTTMNNKKATTSTSLGLACQKCGLKTISLFRFEQSYLVCQKCLKTLKHRY